MLRAIGRVIRRFVKTLLVLIFSVSVVPAVMVGIALVIVLFLPVPVTIPERKVQAAVQPSFVYDANGKLLTVFRLVDSNIPAKKGDFPKVLRNAVVAAEDRRFFTHGGIDIKGLARALQRDIKSGEAEQGASTITQQLVKGVYYPDESTDIVTDKNDGNVITGNANRVWKKLRIAIIANRLDRERSKDDILYEYMNNIFLGNGAYGMSAAAKVYFRKRVQDLTLSEAATLAGIIPAPSKYEPRGNRSSAEVKRKATLRQMLDVGFITVRQFNEALAEELWLQADGPPPAGRVATLVFPQTEVTTRYPYFVDFVRRYVTAKYGEAALYRGGLQINTTLDTRLQDAAELTQANLLKGTKAGLESSIVSVEPLTGYVKALVGGRDFDAPGGKVNLALGDCPSKEKLDRLLGGKKPKLAPLCETDNYVDGGGSGRSPGSSMKPIALAEAFRQGIPQSQVVSGAVYKCKKPRACTIRNYEGAAYGDVDLRQMTIRSVNTSYARLSYDVLGVENVAKMAQKLGITSAWYDPKRHGPSYVLGGLDVSPLEMAAAYSVFAGRGLKASATPILTITDSNGKILEDNVSRQPTRVLSQAVADNVTDVLSAVVSEGTGKRAALANHPVAGKTGTSQGYGNAWFVGYTPTLSTAVWIGYRDSPKPLYNIKGVRRVAGGTLPSLTWSRYMTLAMQGIASTAFDEPAPIIRPAKISAKELVAQRAREGIDLGPKRAPGSTGERTYIDALNAPTLRPPQDPNGPGDEPLLGVPVSTIAPIITATSIVSNGVTIPPPPTAPPIVLPPISVESQPAPTIP